MKKLLAMLLALVMVLSMVACGAKEEPVVEAPTNDSSVVEEKPVEEAPVEEVKESRTLILGQPEAPTSLNAHAVTGNYVLQVGHLYNGFLTAYNDVYGGPIQPAVAESWDYVSATEIIFHLREDVYWHNGRQLTADDVVFTFDWVMNPDNASIRLANYKGKLDVGSVTKVDDFTVKFSLLTPDPCLLEMLACCPLVAEDTVGTLDTAPIGCGPFKFVKWEEGQHIEFETFDQYWDRGTIQYDKLILRTFADYNALMASFLADEIDIMLFLNTTDIATIEAMGGKYYAVTNPDACNYMASTVSDEVLSNPKVREAIKYAIDKQELIDLLLFGNGEAISQPIPTSNEYYNPALDWERDVERAKQALIDAGYPDGVDVEIMCPTARQATATILKEQLEEVGFRISINVQENTPMFEIWNAGNAQLVLAGFAYNIDPSLRSSPIASDYSTVWSRFQYVDAEYNELYGKCLSETDVETRKAIFTRMFEKMIDEAGYYMLYSSTSNCAVKSNIEGVIYRNSGASDFTQITFND